MHAGNSGVALSSDAESTSAATPLDKRDPRLGHVALKAAGLEPTLFVVVDTEEEFDWRAPFDRRHTSVRAMRHVHRAHRILRRYGVIPTYVVDYPVAAQAHGYGPLAELVEDGECTIGAHLHPWVTPPYTEQVNGRNSFACNLGLALEREKLHVLTDTIRQHLRVDPRVYKAGRYGFGPTTVEVLDDLGFAVDMSLQPTLDYTPDGGPSFTTFDTSPFWFGRSANLLEIPCSTGFTGLARRAGQLLQSADARLPMLRLSAFLSRLRLLDRVRISPEGFTPAEQRRLTTTILDAGGRIFCMTFHSPSLEPGHTPYVRSTRDLEQFLERIEAYCEFFFGQIGGKTTTPLAFHAAMQTATPPGGARGADGPWQP